MESNLVESTKKAAEIILIHMSLLGLRPRWSDQEFLTKYRDGKVPEVQTLFSFVVVKGNPHQDLECPMHVDFALKVSTTERATLDMLEDVNGDQYEQYTVGVTFSWPAMVSSHVGVAKERLAFYAQVADLGNCVEAYFASKQVIHLHWTKADKTANDSAKMRARAEDLVYNAKNRKGMKVDSHRPLGDTDIEPGLYEGIVVGKYAYTLTVYGSSIMKKAGIPSVVSFVRTK